MMEIQEDLEILQRDFSFETLGIKDELRMDPEVRKKYDLKLNLKQ